MENKPLREQKAPEVVMNLELSSHQKYLIRVQRDADHEYYLNLLNSVIDGLTVIGAMQMAEVQGDKEACLAIINGFGDCQGCSANCYQIAQAQLSHTIKEWKEKVG